MSTLFLRFAIVLENPEIEKMYRHHGLLFHRWLPDGEKDALIFNTGNENIVFKVWFERFGYLNKGFIEFNLKRRKVDDQNMQQQGILEAGPLFGLLEISNITQKELEQITKDIKGDEYINLGKNIIKGLIHPQIANLINILSLTYGQYWIKGMEKWDSRNISLGRYCELIELQWSLDGKLWKPFVPGEPEIAAIILEIGSNEDYLEYITKEDWGVIKEIVENNVENSLACEYISQSNFHLYQGNLRHAIIDAITALEIVLEEFIDFSINNLGYPNELKNILADIKLMKRLKLVSSLSRKISPHEIEDIEFIYKNRNDIVHDGLKIQNSYERDIKKRLRVSLKAISKFLQRPNIKFPSPNPGNAKMPPELWDKI